MKTNRFKLVCTFLLSVLFVGLSTQNASAKKAKLRMTIEYINDLDQGASIVIHTKAKGEEGVASVPNVALKYYVFNEDTTIHLGDISTDEDGVAKIPVVLEKLKLDTSGLVQFKFEASGNEVYKSARKTYEVRDCLFSFDLEKSEEGLAFNIELLDKETKDPVSGNAVFLGVSRLFKPLPIGEGTYYTDKNGAVFVTYEDSIPSIDGSLEYIAKLDESEMYGTVIKRIIRPYGIMAEREDLFDERTMWSPPNKTPYVLLIVPNLIILFVWGIIGIQIRNLIKIKKS